MSNVTLCWLAGAKVMSSTVFGLALPGCSAEPQSPCLFTFGRDHLTSLSELTVASSQTYIVHVRSVQLPLTALYSMASGGRYESVYDTANSFDPEHEALNSTLAPVSYTHLTLPTKRIV